MKSRDSIIDRSYVRAIYDQLTYIVIYLSDCKEKGNKWFLSFILDWINKESLTVVFRFKKRLTLLVKVSPFEVSVCSVFYFWLNLTSESPSFVVLNFTTVIFLLIFSILYKISSFRRYLCFLLRWQNGRKRRISYLNF